MDRDPMQLALSTDVVMDVVLRYLNVRDLLSCRLASKFWNKAASSVLRKRSTRTKDIFRETELMKLKECMEQSTDFPFAGLKVYAPWRLNSSCAMEFFQNYGDRFTRLYTRTWGKKRLQDVAPFINYLPRLSILEVNVAMPTASPLPVDELPDSAAVLGDGKILKLPSLRTIRIFPASWNLVNEEVLRDILTAASSLVQIECLPAKPGIVRVLESAGQLQAVSFMMFESENHTHRDNLRAEMDQLLITESPSLTKLEFHGRGCLPLDKLERILFSSQDTLKELHLDGPWLSEYPWEDFPVLANLTKLSLQARKGFCNGSLIRGRHGECFPALKEFRLCLEYYSEDGNVGYSGGLFVVPSVTRLHLEGYVDEDGMKQLAQSFPNVIDMRVDCGFYDGEPPIKKNPFKIWSVGDFKCLEKLRIWNFKIKQPSQDHYINMDSFLTGIPVGICENLRKRKRVNLINSQFNEILRDRPSILQLKNLKQLIVCVKPGDEREKLNEDVAFMSMVSVWYALDMMPNLRAKFVFERRLSNFRFYEESDKEVLETAFKYVQPHVKLERFCY